MSEGDEQVENGGMTGTRGLRGSSRGISRISRRGAHRRETTMNGRNEQIENGGVHGIRGIRGILRRGTNRRTNGTNRAVQDTRRVRWELPPTPTIPTDKDLTRTNKTRQPQLRIATLNIIDGRKNRLNAALRCMRQMNIDLGILTETKFNTDRYTKAAEGYKVVGTKAEDGKGGVALIYRDSKGWGLESTQTFGPNVIRTTLVSGGKRWYIIGAYIPPSEVDGKTLDYITQAKETVSNRNWPTILLGDLNVDLETTEETWREGTERRIETATLMITMGLQSMREHFRQKGKKVGRHWTWKGRREGVQYGSVCDHIMTSKRNDFINCQIKIPRMDTDHNALVGTLRLVSEKEHRRYVNSRSKYPISPTPRNERSRAEELLAELREAATPPPKEPGRTNSWISSATWRLIDQKAMARKIGDSLQLRSLKRRVRTALKNDRRTRREAAATACQQFLARGEIREAFGAIKGWYRDRGPRSAKPSKEEIAKTRREYVKLYTDETPTSTPLPLHTRQFPINDEPPTEEEIVECLKKLRNKKAAGATGITAENLKDWQHRARPTKEGVDPDPQALEMWEKVLEIIKLAFEGDIPREFSNGIFVLIPKATPGEYRGIALLEILYKLISSIINARLSEAVQLDDALHGFRAKRGTGTAIMEAKLLAQLSCREDQPLYMIFLDLKKAYDTLDRVQAMRILKGYGVGDNIRRIINTIWEGDTMVPRQEGYYGKPFKAKRGVRQGDIVSPFIFNIMVDAVVRHWRHTHQPKGIDEMALFYADDGVLTGNDPTRVQRSMDIFTEGFLSVGLKMNALKTETMIMTGGKHRLNIRTRAYSRQQTGEGLTFDERRREKVQCDKCGGTVIRPYMKRHQLTEKCIEAAKTYEPTTPERDRVEAEQATTPQRDPGLYTVSIPRGGEQKRMCPIPGCEYGTKSPAQMRRHFRQRHLEDTIVIEEEGQLAQCQLCGFFGATVMTAKHQQTAVCKQFALRRQRYFRAQGQAKARTVVFTIGEQEIKQVKMFKYLGRMMEEEDDDNHAAFRQLKRAREKWGRIAGILNAEGANPKTMGYFYKAIVQAILLYGSETWTLTRNILKRFDSFHARVARYLTGRHIRQLEDGTWFCPPTTEVLEEAGLFSIGEYIRRRRRTVRPFVRQRPLYRACLRSKALGTNIAKVVWWELEV